MCGIIGLHNHSNAAQVIRDSLALLNHRGSDSAGISISDGEKVCTETRMGMALESFPKESLKVFRGKHGIGHDRYSTTGQVTLSNAQPIERQSMFGSFALVHNGNLVNHEQLRHYLVQRPQSIDGSSDTTMIAYWIGQQQANSMLEAIRMTMMHLAGAFSIIVLHENNLYACCDEFKFRPLAIGRRTNEDGSYSHAFASESHALQGVGYEIIGEVQAGQLHHITPDGQHHVYQVLQPSKTAHCVFELMYLAAPPSRIFDRSVYTSRVMLGRQLALEDEAVDPNAIVVPVPASGYPSAFGYAQQLGMICLDGLYRNPYVPRTFIKPTEEERRESIRLKFRPIEAVVAGREIVLVDDSLVRSVTCDELVKMLRSAGATKIHVRIASPPVKSGCYFGVDIKAEKLPAAVKTIDEIRLMIGADSLSYLSIDGACKALKTTLEDFCFGCFTGQYPLETHPLGSLKPISANTLGELISIQPLATRTAVLTSD